MVGLKKRDAALAPNQHVLTELTRIELEYISHGALLIFGSVLSLDCLKQVLSVLLIFSVQSKASQCSDWASSQPAECFRFTQISMNCSQSNLLTHHKLLH